MDQKRETSLPADTPPSRAVKKVLAPVADVFGEFIRVTLLQLAYQRYEIARLKGLSQEDVLEHSTSFMHQDFELLREMLESQSMDLADFELKLQAAVLRDAHAAGSAQR